MGCWLDLGFVKACGGGWMMVSCNFGGGGGVFSSDCNFGFHCGGGFMVVEGCGGVVG